MMRWLQVIADLVIGDDWVIAAGVALALGLTALLADAPAPAWWLLPLAVLGLLALSLSRPLRRDR